MHTKCPQAIGRLLASMLTYWLVDESPKLMSKVFLISSGMIVLTCLPLFWVEEISLNGIAFEAHPGMVLKKTWLGMKRIPTELKGLCVVQMLAWAAWFTLLPMCSEYLGQHHTRGMGVKNFALGTALSSCTEAMLSISTPWLEHRIPSYILYISGFLVLAASLLVLSFKTSESPVYAALGLTGIASAFTNTLPFSLTASRFGDNSQLGLFIGTMNMFIYAPMLLDLGLAVPCTDKQMLKLGAGWAVLAACACPLLRKQGPTRRRDIMV